MRKIELAFKSAGVVAFEIFNAIKSRGWGSKFSLDFGSSINLRLAEECVGLGLKGNNTEFFRWMIVKLRVELHSNLRNCSPITKSDFRDWVDKHFNTYAATTIGIGII